MRNLKMVAIIFAVALSHSVFGNEHGRFISEGSCSCKISWDCLRGVDECAEKEAYQKAVSSCPSGVGAVQVSPFEHEECPAKPGEICNIARADFVCGW